MDGERLDDIEYEILDLIVNDDETTATVLDTIRRPVNAASFSAEARALDFDGLDGVFDRLANRGLASRKLESTELPVAWPRRLVHVVVDDATGPAGVAGVGPPGARRPAALISGRVGRLAGSRRWLLAPAGGAVAR